MRKNPPQGIWSDTPEQREAFELGWRDGLSAKSEYPDGLRYLTKDDTDLDRAYYDGYIGAQKELIDRN